MLTCEFKSHHPHHTKIRTMPIKEGSDFFFGSAQDLAQEHVLSLSKWHIAQRHIYFPTLVEYTPPVGKGIKAGLAVIAAHAGGPHTAERHSGVNQV